MFQAQYIMVSRSSKFLLFPLRLNILYMFSGNIVSLLKSVIAYHCIGVLSISGGVIYLTSTIWVCKYPYYPLFYFTHILMINTDLNYTGDVCRLSSL